MSNHKHAISVTRRIHVRTIWFNLWICSCHKVASYTSDLPRLCAILDAFLERKVQRMSFLWIFHNPSHVTLACAINSLHACFSRNILIYIGCTIILINETHVYYMSLCRTDLSPVKLAKFSFLHMISRICYNMHACVMSI